MLSKRAFLLALIGSTILAGATTPGWGADMRLLFESSAHPPGPDYVLGPGDVVEVRTNDFDDLGAGPFKVDSDGKISFPSLGQIRVADLTTQQVEAELKTLIGEFVLEPFLTVRVTQYYAPPVFLRGAFEDPGLYPLPANTTLVEMLARSELSPGAAKLTVIRSKAQGPLPLPSAVTDSRREVSEVVLDTGDLLEKSSMALNLALRPYDVIRADVSELVYAMGAFENVGGLDAGGPEPLSVLKVMTMAGGVAKGAKVSEAKILRPIRDSSQRAEIDVDVEAILAGRSADLALYPNDILYVPPRKGGGFWKTAGLLVLPSVVTSAVFVALQR